MQCTAYQQHYVQQELDSEESNSALENQDATLKSLTTRLEYLRNEAMKNKNEKYCPPGTLVSFSPIANGLAEEELLVKPVEDLFTYTDNPNLWTIVKRTLQNLGLSYGDLCTSTLYTISTLVYAANGKIPSELEIMASGSIIFWLLILVPTIKYTIFVPMADHNGEGGAFAIIGLLKQKNVKPKVFQVAKIVAMIGAGALLADGTLTPAISVVSAIQGLQVGIPSLSTSSVVGISVAILFIVFVGQPLGSSRIGWAYGPILFVFCICQSVAGIRNIIYYPKIFQCINPWYAFRGIGYVWNDNSVGFVKLSAALLSLTGSEAMYADMGHFGRTPMRIGWLGIVFPSVLLSYFGQLAMIAAQPELAIRAGDKIFFYQVSTQLLWPLIVISTLAAIVASQAIVSGAFSIMGQAVAMDLFPRLRVKRTNTQIYGQVFLPEINIILAIITLSLEVGFRTSSALTSAFGVAVSTSFVTTSFLYTLVIAYGWKKPWYIWIGYPLVLGTVDILLWSSSLTKVPTGGYVPVVICLITVFLMSVWQWGSKQQEKYMTNHCLRWSEYQQYMASPTEHLTCRVQAILNKLHVLPRVLIFVTIRSAPVPFVDEDVRFHLIRYSQSLYRLVVNIGYAEKLLHDPLSFFKGRTELKPRKDAHLIHRWMVRLCNILKHVSANIDEVLGLPVDTLEIGTVAVI
ncbi:Probable potassium transport system protein kup 1 [Galdieria sulphuraria]|nr:Probable potassium transport system protein kup 1 [Galdieria sulphuraria]